MTPQDKSSDNLTRPKKSLPAAMAAGAARHAFKPGRVGVMMCEAPKADGGRCGQIAVKGLRDSKGRALCYVHGRSPLARLRKKGRARCEALNIKRPRKQCEHAAKRHGLCGHHASIFEARGEIERVPANRRALFVPFSNGDTGLSALARGRFKPPSGAHLTKEKAQSAPRELAALPVWREATIQERAALVQAWEGRDTSPGAWRAIVREVMTRERTDHESE